LTSWQRRLGIWIRTVGAAACLLLSGACASAQSIESVVRPGDLVQGHAKWEEECAKCHVRFDRAAQDRLCMDCHKEVGQDVRERTGFHGRLKPQACKTCHTDHKGRTAQLADLDKTHFDHTQTDYALHGKHAKVQCEKCHEPKKKYWQASSDCNSCHRKDDVHKGSLGPKCADCHTENDWKEAKFDHEKTRFALRDKHANAKCVDCHKKGSEYKEAPRACIGCHRKEDEGPKGHKGLYGERCDTCHGAKAWKPSIFNHDTDTKYALRGKHRTTKCADCHTGHLYKDKVGSACIDCHKKDDDSIKGHKGSLGRDCAACHVETGWKERSRFDHDKTQFPLLGKHVDTKCADCHKSTNYKEAPKDCIGCHKKDDKHEATLGTKCQDCHVERDWKTTKGRFDHERTRFKLRNAHAATTVQCKACHVDLKHYRDTPMDCFSCHRKDDKHEGQQGPKCETCHGDKNWKTTTFDHGLTRFPLLGKHAKVECKDCHKSPRFKDAKLACVACHLKDDTHKKTLGPACEQCHNARTWKAWDFDHDTRTKYALDGKHKGVACKSCHVQPMEGKVTASTRCVTCHAKNDVHDGTYGRQCEQCHVTSSFRTIRSRSGVPTSAIELPSGPSQGAWPTLMAPVLGAHGPAGFDVRVPS
jgi:hypothetical protein